MKRPFGEKERAALLIDPPMNWERDRLYPGMEMIVEDDELPLASYPDVPEPAQPSIWDRVRGAVKGWSAG